MSNKDRVKIVCISLFIVLLTLGALTDYQLVTTTSAFSGDLQNGFTGAPGEPTCATSGCHTGALNTGRSMFEIEIDGLSPEGVYEPGREYTVTVRPTKADADRRRWGFQLTVLNNDNSGAGTLIDVDSNLTRILSDSGPNGDRQYIQHTRDSTFRGQPFQEEEDRISWTFRWRAPDFAEGPITFYIAGVQANNNGRTSGDQVSTSFLSLLSEPLPPPFIDETRIEIRGKKLFVGGGNFAEGADIYVNDEKQKTSNDEDNPSTLLIAKKAGKKIEPGETVTIKVINPDGNASNEVSFTRPVE